MISTSCYSGPGFSYLRNSVWSHTDVQRIWFKSGSFVQVFF